MKLSHRPGARCRYVRFPPFPDVRLRPIATIESGCRNSFDALRITCRLFICPLQTTGANAAPAAHSRSVPAFSVAAEHCVTWAYPAPHGRDGGSPMKEIDFGR